MTIETSDQCHKAVMEKITTTHCEDFYENIQIIERIADLVMIQIILIT